MPFPFLQRIGEEAKESLSRVRSDIQRGVQFVKREVEDSAERVGQEFEDLSKARLPRRKQESQEETSNQGDGFFSSVENFLGEAKSKISTRFSEGIKEEKEELSENLKKPSLEQFVARTGVAFADLVTESADFAADFVAKNIPEIVTVGHLAFGNGLGAIPVVNSEHAKKLNQEWIEFYNKAKDRGAVPQAQAKEMVDRLQEQGFMKTTPEWQEAPLEKKLTERLPETIYNIGPSIISSFGAFALNPTLGFSAISGAVANDVKDSAIEHGVKEERAELLGAATGILVGVLERIVPSRIFSSGGIKNKFVGNFARRIADTTILETGTEIAQENVQLIAEASFRDVGLDEAATRNAMAALGGALGGAGIQTIASFANEVQRKEILESVQQIRPGLTIEEVEGVSEDRNLLEVENEDLSLPELKKKLEIAIEGNEDEELLDIIRNDIAQREKEDVSETAPTRAISDELAQEARKFKSAEEAVTSDFQDQRARGGGEPFSVVQIGSEVYGNVFSSEDVAEGQLEQARAIDEDTYVGQRHDGTFVFNPKTNTGAFNTAEEAENALIQDAKDFYNQTVNGAVPAQETVSNKVIQPTKSSVDVDINKLVSIKEEPESSIQEAKRRVAQAEQGNLSPREPLKVVELNDGRMLIVDGNATFRALQDRGGRVPVEFVDISKASFKPTDEQLAVAVRMHQKGSELVDEYIRLVEEIAEETGTKMAFPNTKAEKVKPVGSLLEKMFSRGEDVRDLVRDTILIEGPNEIDGVVDALKERGAQGIHIPNDDRIRGLKNRFLDPSPGYKDANFQFTLNGEVFELQMINPRMLKVKEQWGHLIYDLTEKVVPKIKNLSDVERKAIQILESISNTRYERALQETPSRSKPLPTVTKLSSKEAGTGSSFFSKSEITSIRDALKILREARSATLRSSVEKLRTTFESLSAITPNVPRTQDSVNAVSDQAFVPNHSGPLLEGDVAIEGEGFFMSESRRRVQRPETRLRREAETRKRRQEKERILSKVMSEKQKAERRRMFVRNVRDFFGLTDSDLKSISRRDIRLMSDFEFKQYLDEIRLKAVDVADTKQAKAELLATIDMMNLGRIENYRRTQGFPPIREMTAQQMRQYEESLRQFQVGDVFLTQRQLEVVDRTNLTGVKTLRESRERLVEELKKQGVETTVEELQKSLNISAFDTFRSDISLQEQNPFYAFVVERTHSHIINAEASFLQIQERINELAKKANKSRKRGLGGTIRQAIIPKHTEIVAYLEAPPQDKQFFAEQLTSEEIEYAAFVEQYYSEAYNHLVSIKELYGSRFVDQYFTHTRKTFLEEFSDNGIISAFRNWYTSHKEDQQIANIVDQDTGNILPKAKFFQYTLQRTGELEPSRNLTRVFLQYARVFERKKGFDQMIPEVDIYTQSLTPQQLTPRGLEMDRKLKTFINKWLNNKKGRRETFGGIIKQNGPADMAMRMGNTLVSLVDLGLALFPSTAATVGEQVMTYQALGKRSYIKAWKRRVWDLGIRRKKTKGGQSILKEAEPFIGRNIWTELAEPDKGVGERLMQAIFSPFSQSTVEANKLFLLGTITFQELENGNLSEQRLAQIKLEAGRWRDISRDVRSIFASTSVGETSLKYKGWAVPILRTTVTDISKTASRIKNKKFREALTAREAQELYRAIEMSFIIFLIGSAIIGEDDDDSFLGKLKARVYMEAMTFLGGIDPTLFLSTPRLYSFLQEFAQNIKKVVTLEEYETNTRWGEKGELKGFKGLQRQFTPSFFEQFQGGEEESRGGGTKLPSRSGGGLRNKIKLPSRENGLGGNRPSFPSR